MYETIRPLFLRNQITTFQELFKHVPDTAVAGSLGKRTERFRELIKNVDQFKIEEIILMAKLFRLDLKDMFVLLERELSRLYADRLIIRSNLQNIVAMYEEKKILRLTDVFKYLTIKDIATAIGERRVRLAQMKSSIKKLPLRLPINVGLYSNLSIGDTLRLIEEDYLIQNKVSI